MNDVWVVQGWEGEYRTVFGVYTYPWMAIISLKMKYGSPYIVEWHETFRDENNVTITGNFDYVPQCSVRHSSRYTITKWEVE